MYNLSIIEQTYIIKNYKLMKVHDMAIQLQVSEDNIRGFIGYAQGYLKKEIRQIAQTDKVKAREFQDKYNKFFAKAYPFLCV